MGSLEIRLFEERDLERILHIIHTNIDGFAHIEQDGERTYTDEQLEGMKHRYSSDHLKEASRKGHLYVVTDGDMVVGVGGYSPRSYPLIPFTPIAATIECAYVDPAYKRHGAFPLLVKQVITQAYREGIRTLTGYAILDPYVEDKYQRIGCTDEGVWEVDLGNSWIPQRRFSLDVRQKVREARRRKKKLQTVE